MKTTASMFTGGGLFDDGAMFLTGWFENRRLPDGYEFEENDDG